MRELSLFSGAGGGLLGTKLLGWKHCGYVEYNDYCQRVIAQRIADGILDEAPIYGDIRTFISEGYASSYTGMVDVITAGFPCQPFSVAGNQKGADDERNMWPQTLECIRLVRPRMCLLENVPGLLAHKYAQQIYGDLAESGFDVRWRVLSAAEMGAPHKRDRLWIVADDNSQRGRLQSIAPTGQAASNAYDNGEEESMANSKSERRRETWTNCERSEERIACRSTVSNTECFRPQRQGRPINGMREASEGERKADFIVANSGWGIEPDVGRVANELADWLDFFGAFRLCRV